MLKLQTPVEDVPCRTGISYGSKILLLGSCFSDNIGARLAECGFDVMVNPFGTLYNPESIAGAVERLRSGREFTPQDCVQMGSGSPLVCSFSHHTSFARATREEFLANANGSLEKAAAFYAECDRVIITLGTSWCFRNLGSGRVVANCLKREAREFSREMMPPERSAELLRRIIAAGEVAEKGADGRANGEEGGATAGARGSARQKKYIFTVSPIRHFRDGAHGNLLSKAALMIAVDMLTKENPDTDYFPAYEIMTDELRDYRFYAEDMLHPSAQAAEYIFERFCNWALPKSEHPRLEEAKREFKRRSHIENRRTLQSCLQDKF